MFGRKITEQVSVLIIGIYYVGIGGETEQFLLGFIIILETAVTLNMLLMEIGKDGAVKSNSQMPFLLNSFGSNFQNKILTSGFEYKGREYKSLSMLAKEISGYTVSGPIFFGLRKPKAKLAA